MTRARVPPLRDAAARLVRRFACARDGATAVEFAIVSVPFLALVFATFELAMMLLVSTSLEASAQSAARTLRTGAFQAGGGTAAAYKEAICSGLGWLQDDCRAKLQVDVRTFGAFSQVDAPWPVTDGAIDPAQLAFQPGGACAIVLARAFYDWTLLAPDLSGVAHLGGGRVLLSAAAAFRNEPFAGQTCT